MFMYEQRTTKLVSGTVESRSTDTHLIPHPDITDSFVCPDQKEAYIFSLKLIHLIQTSGREEKSLHHVAMVAKFLDDNKPKRHLKSGFAQFQTSFNFIQFVKCWRDFLG